MYHIFEINKWSWYCDTIVRKSFFFLCKCNFVEIVLIAICMQFKMFYYFNATFKKFFISLHNQAVQ